jgi:NadR type nicotinamide-nucleotide adenylyltransferase
MKELRKIVIIGPESTGKSTLCRQLAEHYDTVWCPEYAREYLLREGRDYDYEDLLKIAQGQWEQEELLIPQARNGFYFLDTNQYVMKIWCEVTFGQCHKWILDRVAEQEYDLYLLCNTDLPWVEDELREYPDPAIRQKLFLMYKDLLVNNGTHWEEISGKQEERLERAISIIDHFFAR